MLVAWPLFARFLIVVGLAMCTWADGTGIASLPYNFTIAALNTTLPNANSTGVPLVLGQNGEYKLSCQIMTELNSTLSVSGASTGISFYVTSV